MSGEKETVEITFERRIRVPTVPNVVAVYGSDERISIGDLNREQLTEIAEGWEFALLKRAEEIRKAKEEG